MQSLTVIWELKLNMPFCLPYQRRPHQLHLLAANFEEECLCADAAWMSLPIKQNMFSVSIYTVYLFLSPIYFTTITCVIHVIVAWR